MSARSAASDRQLGGRTMNVNVCVAFRLTSLAAAVVAVAPAFAAEPEDPTKPVSSVSAGVGYVDRDGRRFGEYNGMNQKGGYGLLDVYLNRRDDATGTWTQLEGRNLGLDSRQL